MNILIEILIYLDLVRIAGIEPASSPWQREILPFDHIRIFSLLTHVHNMYTHIYIFYIPRSYLCSTGPKTLFRMMSISFFIQEV